MADTVLVLVVRTLDHGRVAPVGAVLALVGVLSNFISVRHKGPNLGRILIKHRKHLMELRLNFLPVCLFHIQPSLEGV
jgi:hypothetical protein